jgi:hypothetical protein
MIRDGQGLHRRRGGWFSPLLRAVLQRSKRRPQPEVGKIDAKQKASALAREPSECVSALVHRSKRRLQPKFGKIDAKQKASALARERSECVSALPARSRAACCILLAFVCAATAPASGWAEPCQGRIGPETNITGKTAYDPFSPADVADDYRISVINTGAASCAFGLLFRARTARAELGGTLAYSLTGASGQPLLATSPSAASAPLLRLTSPLAPSATGWLEFQLGIARGQFARPGLYRDAVELQLYALDENGRPAGAPLQTATLAAAYTVPRVLSVNLKGGELATTLGFGTLVKGQERKVEIQARGNQNYGLHVSSDNRGVLLLTPKIPGQDWSVPYTATFAEQPLDLRAATSLRNLPPTQPESDASHPLVITIGDAGQKRAGRYEDVITIEIIAAAP